jgi:hypothetical protein
MRRTRNQLHLNFLSVHSALFEHCFILSFPFPFVPLQRRGCLVAPLFLRIVLDTVRQLRVSVLQKKKSTVFGKICKRIVSFEDIFFFKRRSIHIYYLFYFVPLIVFLLVLYIFIVSRVAQSA